jgi:hypothetical protein
MAFHAILFPMFGVKVAPSTVEASAELQSVLASPLFVRSPRLSRLLQYLCTKYLDGTEVKEYQIGVEVLGRPSSFDPAEDAAARVEAHRLRKRLREYYETEGRSHSLRIEVPLGHYAVVFQSVAAEPPLEEKEEPTQPLPSAGTPPPSVPLETASVNPPPRQPINYRKAGLAGLAVALLVTVTIVALGRHRITDAPQPVAVKTSGSVVPPATSIAARIPPPGVAGNSVRIACGRTANHTDRWGDVWEQDRDFEGGTPFEIHRQYIARAYDPRLFQAGRTGNFTYKIPLAAGVYELHLFFMEGTYGPGMPAGGGEISRIFEVRANGEPILNRFDIYSDAGGSNIADVRVFKDISPGPGGKLTLSFQGWTGLPLLNAIELIPASPHRLNPIRIVTQEGFYTDSNGAVWKPDRYYMGGQNAVHSVEMHGTRDPELFARERYGHFNYAIPVDKGTYRLTLYLAEEYFGPGGTLNGQPGTRVFDVDCNGTALLREFDPLKEAGLGQAVIKTFHGITPNGQGKLLVSFSPVHDYASMYALEVVDESN